MPKKIFKMRGKFLNRICKMFLIIILSALNLKNLLIYVSKLRVMKSDYVNNGVPFYRSKEIIRKSKGLELEDVFYISDKVFNNFKKNWFSTNK